MVERQEHDAGVGLVGAREEVETRHAEGVVNSVDRFGDLRHAVEDGIGAVNSRGIGENDRGDEVALILLRNESDRHPS